MPSVERVDLPLVDENGRPVAHLEVGLLPKRTRLIPEPLLDQRLELARDQELEPVQLLESHEYRYRLITNAPPTASHWLEPAEMFEPDDVQGLTGRLRPRLSTGRVTVVLRDEFQELARSAFEVRSRKLDYVRHYRWMLRDIGDVTTELIMERFAASEQRFSIDDQFDSRSLYQQFQFLRSALADELDTALHVLTARPYVSWIDEEHIVDPARGVRMSSQVQRQWSRPGPRSIGHQDRVDSFPVKLRALRTEATYDNIPNRFVKFALQRWRDIALHVDMILSLEGSSHPVARGRRDAQVLAETVDRWLAAPIFNEVTNLDRFPAGNQVLYKREGYREILRVFLQSELASKIAWAGGEDVYSAGQRDVAALYEYWVFFEVARVVSALCAEPLDLSSLVDLKAGTLNLNLTRDRASKVTGRVERLGRTLRLELWFNRTFSGRPPHHSWTRPMRPDVALLISSEAEDPTFDDVWLHFDAKYRIDALEEIMGPPATDDGLEALLPDDEDEDPRSAARRTDLLKMHAYKDAINRSAGAYVLYPGTELELKQEYHEILPGVGAFVLRPTEGGAADGSTALSRFVNDVVSHLSSQRTQHERGRFWRQVSYSGLPVRDRTPAAQWLRRPPADTLVLLGYVKSAQHTEWIRRNHLYNLRADKRTGSVDLHSRELAADVALLYGPGVSALQIWLIEGPPQLLTRGEMIARAYPRPGGEKYLCLRLNREVTELSGPLLLDSVHQVLSRAARAVPVGFPIVVTWQDLVQ